ncbi:hypothetical protein H4P35_17410 [Achromobacter sp. 77]|uniref:hypothetical protein n=1 Tax=Achromobacter sp. 77 TaxID=2756133 RepID=UPI001D008F74|nr:hypothetical protein [Achromobacter sp. 77]UDG74014.1 hypothetical protein H4P35_17410 [Achromobacter sp. 77]
MQATKQAREPRPSFRKIQEKWRLFRFASTLLPALPDTQESAAIVATRLNDDCAEVVSNTLQTEGAGFLLRLFTFFGLLSFFGSVRSIRWLVCRCAHTFPRSALHGAYMVFFAMPFGATLSIPLFESTV